MSDESTKESDEWFADPPEPDPDTLYFKWGWNEANGEAVWEVGGPGDGWPGHRDHLLTAWGREPGAGDILGGAEHVPARGSDRATVSIYAYGGRIPDVVAAWFRRWFPDAEVRLGGAE